MKTRQNLANRYRCISIAMLLSSGSLLQILPVLADQNSPIPGTAIENQATASFTDTADNSTGNILSNKVSVSVAEVAGISATGSGVSGTAYRTNTVLVDFLVKNEGNDPTQFFIPATPSVATINGAVIPAANIGQLQVIEYNNVTTTTTVTTNNLVNTTTGSTTGSLTGIPNNGSIPAGGYVKVRVPVILPFTASVGDTISITLGNTGGQPSATNTPYVVGANGTGGNDLYTQDNTGTANGDFAGNPINGDIVNHRQEASASQVVTVVAPPTINIKGTVIGDANGSGTATFTGIRDGTEIGANISPAINAILVDGNGKVLATTLVATDGTYTLTTLAAQNGLYVVLSTSTGTVGSLAPAPGLPATFTGTTPLTYIGQPFNVATTDVTGKDFGVDKLPVTAAISAATQANPPGTIKYQVATFSATDGEDGALGSGNTFKIVTIPNSVTQGTLFYNGVAVTAGQIITLYDPTKLTIDPIDGNVSVSFTYAAVDAANKIDPNPATVSMTFSATPIGISGTVYNDKDNSANGTFTNIQTNGETGTDAVYGTTTVPDNAILVDATTGNVLATTVVSSTGAYSFANVLANTNVRVLLSPTAGTIGSLPPIASAPTGWVVTSPQDTGVFNTGLLPIVKDFGIRQKAKFVMVKRVTRVNGVTTNPNDGTVLGNASADSFNNVGNWPTNYLVGSVNAGVVKPSDTIEYTVYFLNNQGADATNVKICDPIVGAQTYVPGSIQLQLGVAATATSLTDSNDANDRANFYAAGAAPIDCNAGAIPGGTAGVAIGITGATTTNQAAVTGVPGATAVATPSASYGLFRFVTQVKP